MQRIRDQRTPWLWNDVVGNTIGLSVGRMTNPKKDPLYNEASINERLAFGHSGGLTSSHLIGWTWKWKHKFKKSASLHRKTASTNPIATRPRSTNALLSVVTFHFKSRLRHLGQSNAGSTGSDHATERRPRPWSWRCVAASLPGFAAAYS